MARTSTVQLLTGDYPDRLEAIALEAQEIAKDKTPRTALEGDPYAEVEERYNALKAEAIEEGTTVHLAAVGRRTWRSLKEKHPPRSGEGVDKDTADGDRMAGVNTDAVEDDLVFESIRAWQQQSGETVDHLASTAAFEDWADTLSEGEWQVLVRRAWELANGARLDPKDLPPSPTRSDD